MSHECLIERCTREYDTELGMKMHLSKTHRGEDEYESILLQKLWERKEELDHIPTSIDMDDGGFFPTNRYQDAFGSWNDALLEAGLEPHTKEKEEVECDECGSTMMKHYSRIERSDADFCSPECHSEYRRKITGEDHPLYDRVRVTCDTCGDEFNTHACRRDRQDNIFCCRECFWEHEKRVRGEDHPLYQGYPGGIPYGPGWESKSKEVRERDCHICRVCESTHTIGRSMYVHHIRPRKTFYEEAGCDVRTMDWESCDDPDNLITLCSECHGKLEGMFTSSDHNEFEKKAKEYILGDR